MTKANVNQMIKTNLIEALRRSHYDLLKADVSFPKGGLFVNNEDRMDAYRTSCSILQMLKHRASKDVKTNPTEVERFIDERIVELSFMKAYGSIGIDIAVGKSAAEHIQEARVAIEMMKKIDRSVASVYQRQLNAKIGEE